MQLLGGLEKEERRLFHDRMRHLDRSIAPGTHKLTWATPKQALDFYFREAGQCGLLLVHTRCSLAACSGLGVLLAFLAFKLSQNQRRAT